MNKRQWADQYGSQWYRHYDGRPPHDDDNDYEWTGSHWQIIWYNDEEDFYEHQD